MRNSFISLALLRGEVGAAISSGARCSSGDTPWDEEGEELVTSSSTRERPNSSPLAVTLGSNY